MVDFLLASNLSCARVNEVVARVAEHPSVSEFARTEVIKTLTAEAPEGCVVVDPRRK